MRKALLIIIAFISALILSELIVAYFVKYPSYGVEKKIKISGSNSYQNIYKPYSKYWNVEGGNRIFSRNNFGVPGIDLDLSNNKSNIFVLGSSYVEAYQIPPETISTSILNRLLEKEFPNYQVINFGASGHDPYDSWLRTKYYEKKLKPSFVILVIQSTYEQWFKRHKHPLDFDFSKLGKENRSISTLIQIKLRNNSHLLNLFAQYLKKVGKSQKKRTENQVKKEEILIEYSSIPEDLYTCVKEFDKQFGDQFFLISIINDDEVNEKIKYFCHENMINFSYSPITKSKNKINGVGHLNIQGNKLLGELMYETLKTNIE